MPQERYTPGPWKFEAGNIVDRANSAIAQVYGAQYIHGNANGKLIAEAPNMFALLKQGLDLDKNEERQCPCALCEAARRIVARVLGEE